MKKESSVARGIKCGRCWILVERCLCTKVTPLRTVTRPWRFLIYMSREDYLNGGNSAKLLSVAAPTRSQIFVHGRLADEQRLRGAGTPVGKEDAFPSRRLVDRHRREHRRHEVAQWAASQSSSRLLCSRSVMALPCRSARVGSLS